MDQSTSLRSTLANQVLENRLHTLTRYLSKAPAPSDSSSPPSPKSWLTDWETVSMDRWVEHLMVYCVVLSELHSANHAPSNEPELYDQILLPWFLVVGWLVGRVSEWADSTHSLPEEGNKEGPFSKTPSVQMYPLGARDPGSYSRSKAGRFTQVAPTSWLALTTKVLGT